MNKYNELSSEDLHIRSEALDYLKDTIENKCGLISLESIYDLGFEYLDKNNDDSSKFENRGIYVDVYDTDDEDVLKFDSSDIYDEFDDELVDAL